VAASPVFLFSPLVVQKVDYVNLTLAAPQSEKFDPFEGVLRTIGNVTRSQHLCDVEINLFVTRQSLLSLSLTETKRSVENVPFGALALRVICHKVSSTSKFFFGDWISSYGNHFKIEGGQRAMFWKSELGALWSLRWSIKLSTKSAMVKQKCTMNVPFLWCLFAYFAIKWSVQSHPCNQFMTVNDSKIDITVSAKEHLHLCFF